MGVGARTLEDGGEMEMVGGVLLPDLGKGGGLQERISSLDVSCCVSNLTLPLKASPNLVRKDNRRPLASFSFFSQRFLLISVSHLSQSCFLGLMFNLSLVRPISPSLCFPVSVPPHLCVHAFSLHFYMFPVFPSLFLLFVNLCLSQWRCLFFCLCFHFPCLWFGPVSPCLCVCFSTTLLVSLSFSVSVSHYLLAPKDRIFQFPGPS